MDQPQTNVPVQTSTPKKSKGGLIAVIIIAAVVVLVGSGIGCWYGWKYISAKYLKKSTTGTTSSLTLAQLEEALKYPNGTVTTTDHSKAGGYTSEISMETSDAVKTVYDYYLALGSSKNWTISRKSLEADSSRGAVTLVGANNEFEANLSFIGESESTAKTMIYVTIAAENLASGESTTQTATPTSSTAKKTISTDYVISDSDTRLIAESELKNLTPWELKVARNEIYARHGREFVHKDLQCYFATKSWYSMDPNFSESSLSNIESANVMTIQGYEKSTDSPLQSTDSGC